LIGQQRATPTNENLSSRMFGKRNEMQLRLVPNERGIHKQDPSFVFQVDLFSLIIPHHHEETN
jgi:hypothetical protein